MACVKEKDNVEVNPICLKCMLDNKHNVNPDCIHYASTHIDSDAKNNNSHFNNMHYEVMKKWADTLKVTVEYVQQNYGETLDMSYGLELINILNNKLNVYTEGRKVLQKETKEIHRTVDRILKYFGSWEKDNNIKISFK